MTEVTLTIEDLSPLKDNRTTKLIKIAGELDETNVDDQMQKVYEVIGEHPANLDIIFDFQDLGYLNSKTIGYLTDIYGKLSETNGKVAIFAARPNVLDTLQVVGLTQLLNMYDSLEQAKQGIISELTGPVVETTSNEATTQASTQSAIQPNEATTQVPTQSAVQPNEANTQAPTQNVAQTDISTQMPSAEAIQTPAIEPEASQTTIPVTQVVPQEPTTPVAPVVTQEVTTPIAQVMPQTPTTPVTPVVTQEATAPVAPVATTTQAQETIMPTIPSQEISTPIVPQNSATQNLSSEQPVAEIPTQTLIAIPPTPEQTAAIPASPEPTPIQDDELEGSNQDQSSYSFEK